MDWIPLSEKTKSSSSSSSVGTMNCYTSTKDSIVMEDTIIGYLSENSPDLLLSVLACMNLTLSSPPSSSSLDSSSEDIMKPSIILPAMINCRWTSLEITKALSPFPKVQQQQRQQSQRQKQHNTIEHVTMQAHTNTHGEGEHYHHHHHHHVHITILLYGEGYESVAKEAASRSPTTTMKSSMAMDGGGGERKEDTTTTAAAVITRSHYVVESNLVCHPSHRLMDVKEW